MSSQSSEIASRIDVLVAQLIALARANENLVFDLLPVEVPNLLLGLCWTFPYEMSLDSLSYPRSTWDDRQEIRKRIVSVFSRSAFQSPEDATLEDIERGKEMFDTFWADAVNLMFCFECKRPIRELIDDYVARFDRYGSLSRVEERKALGVVVENTHENFGKITALYSWPASKT